MDLLDSLIQHRTLESIDLRIERPFLFLSGLVLGLQRSPYSFNGLVKLTRSFVDLTLEINHVRVVRLVGLELVLVLAEQLSPLLPEGLHRRICEDVGRPHALGALGRTPALFCLDQIGLGGGEVRIESAEIGSG